MYHAPFHQPETRSNPRFGQRTSHTLDNHILAVPALARAPRGQVGVHKAQRLRQQVPPHHQAQKTPA